MVQYSQLIQILKSKLKDTVCYYFCYFFIFITSDFLIQIGHYSIFLEMKRCDATRKISLTHMLTIFTQVLRGNIDYKLF